MQQESVSETAASALFARQPIYDISLNVQAYELLFRPRNEATAQNFDGDRATSQVILNALTEVNINEISDQKPVFVNFTEKWLLEPPPFNPKQVVIEILENIKISPPLIKQVQKLSQAGFTIALDDFEYSKEWDPILEVTDYVKLDVLKLSSEQLKQNLNHISKYNTKLLAEKIEDYEKLKECISLGFSYFQGYFLCRPQEVPGKQVPASRLAVMRLMSELQDPEVSIDHLDILISRDPSLSYKILRIINSAAYTTATKIESINRAITLLGLNKVKSWASLISLSQLSDKPDALLTVSLTRARMCELISATSNLGPADMYFTIGLFSVLDAFFDQDMETVLENLPLTEDTKDALLYHKGTSGQVLASVIALEQADWNKIDWYFLQEIGIHEKTLESCFVESIHWAHQAFNQIIGR